MILVAACLAGMNCNYKGESSPNERVMELVRRGKAIYICPEQAGGLPTPRSGARIIEGDGNDVLDYNSKVISDGRRDFTREFRRGAEETWRTADRFGIKIAILKQRSPSCGCGYIQGGKYKRMLTKGNGVTTAYLIRRGIKVLSEESLNDEDIWRELLTA